MLDADTPFAAAVAVAPVTDWTLYDTAYTERYLGLCRKGGKAAHLCAVANLTTRAPSLLKPSRLLLVHGTADDNVLFEHTLRLVEALQQRRQDLRHCRSTPARPTALPAAKPACTCTAACRPSSTAT